MALEPTLEASFYSIQALEIFGIRNKTTLHNRDGQMSSNRRRQTQEEDPDCSQDQVTFFQLQVFLIKCNVVPLTPKSPDLIKDNDG